MRDRGFSEWGKTSGADAQGNPGFGMVVLRYPKEAWDALSPGDLLMNELLVQGKPSGFPYGAMDANGEEPPATYAFKTREGGIGLLQIIGFTQAPPGVKIRYKMVQGLAAEKDAAEPRRTVLRGLDLTDAPRTTKLADLPVLWEERPPGSRSYKLRDRVVVGRDIELALVGQVYYVPDRDVFYVQYDPVGSSTLTYYGPFEGKPWGRLGIPEPEVKEPVRFGPMMKRVVNYAHVRTDALIDLDTGKLFSLPEGADRWGSVATATWMAERGIDAGAQYSGSYRSSWGLLSYGLSIDHVNQDDFERLAPNDVRQRLTSQMSGVQATDSTPSRISHLQWGTTFAFKTREGGMTSGAYFGTKCNTMRPGRCLRKFQTAWQL